MKARPTIFLSGVSHEFGTFRDAVENEIEMKGCFAENQHGFAPDYQTVEAMLTRRIGESDAVFCIIGFRFGAEPNHRPPGAARRSYTQMEFDVARRLGKPVFLFLSKDATVRDTPKADEQPEDTEAQALQLAHRDAVTKANHLYYHFKGCEELCKLAAEIPIVAEADFKEDIGRVLKHAGAEPIGRDDWFPKLDAAALDPAMRIVSLIAFGGVGKTTLVAHWLSLLAAHNWRVGKTDQSPGVPCDRVFGWSFYSQGTSEDGAASADQFIAQALTFFGDATLAASNAGPWDKGVRLAQLVTERPSLLVLDGLEPLQHPPGPLTGRLKDPGIEALLTTLAGSRKQTFAGSLCVITSRESVAELVPFHKTTASEYKLDRLSDDAGGRVLHRAGATRAGAVSIAPTDAELRTASREVGGHALTLQLLGGYLRLAAEGDIRRRNDIHLSEADLEYKTNPADADKPYGHAFKVMGAYAKWLATGGENGARQLAVLRIMGLFDRPADLGCLGALRKVPAIPGLTEPLVNLTDAQWNTTITRLAECGLVLMHKATDPQPSTLKPQSSLDAHPLIREYFAKQLSRQRPDAWKAAHRRLYEHLTTSTPDKPQPTLDDLQPLYQAVAHGCKAGLHQEALLKVYYARIARRDEAYAVKKLGAFGVELAGTGCFFEKPWEDLASGISESNQAFLFSNAAFCLRALGRLIEALDPMRTAMQMEASNEHWANAAAAASNLSQLELTLGEVAGAVGDAEQSVAYADRSGDAQHRVSTRATLADALHQSGRRVEAESRFREAERMQAQVNSDYPLLYSLRGFHYCDLHLAAPERTAWQAIQEIEVRNQKSKLVKTCRAVEQRATRTLKWAEHNQVSLLSPALDHLTLGRAAFYRTILKQSKSEKPKSEIENAVAGLRCAGQQQHLPLGLLTRAWLRFLEGDEADAQADLDEAWQIAERGSMKLFQADIHLHRARLFFREKPYPWTSPEADFAAAEKLINDCGYHRRGPELADAKKAILGET